jgi:hypothetical protein
VAYALVQILATVVPAWPKVSPGWDWWPFLTVPAALLLGRFVAGIRLRPVNVGLLALGGTAWAYLGDGWGMPFTLSAGFLLAVVYDILIRHVKAR